jgi:hypothetical protein
MEREIHNAAMLLCVVVADLLAGKFPLCEMSNWIFQPENDYNAVLC